MGARGRNHSLAVVVAALLVGACQSTPPVTFTPSAAAPAATAVATPSPTPTPVAGTATPAPTPTPSVAPSPIPSTSPAAAGWPYQTGREIAQTLFPDDGRVVVVERDWVASRSYVMTLDPDGRAVAGWPWSVDTGNPISVAALGPDASIYVAVRGQQGDPIQFTWALHRLDRGGQEMPGFPVQLPSVGFCGLQASVAGIAYVTCDTVDANGDATGTVLTALRPDGSAVYAVPVTFPGTATMLGFGASDLPVVAIADGAHTVVRALTAGGGTRWSTAAINGVAQLDRQGRVRVTRYRYAEGECGATIRTTYDLLGSNGRRPAGWPLSVNGWASGPAVLDDGSMVVVTSGGRAIRYSLQGTVAAGWPAGGIDVAFECTGGTTPATDGRAIVIVGHQRVTALGPGGRVLPGWPANPLGQNANGCPSCTPGSGAPVDPVLGSGHLTYVATVDPGERPRVAAIAADGTIGSQVIVGAKGADTTWLAAAPTGRIWAVTALQDNDATAGTLSLVADVVH